MDLKFDIYLIICYKYILFFEIIFGFKYCFKDSKDF